MASSAESEGDSFEVDEILDSRKSGRKREYLVRWKGCGVEEDSWEPVRNLRNSTDLIEAYDKKMEDHGKQLRQKRTSVVTRRSGRSASAISMTTKTTRTLVNTTIEKPAKMSPSSSPDNSPKAVRRTVTKTETTARVSASEPAVAFKPLSTKSAPAPPSQTPQYKDKVFDLPFIIQLVCVAIIVLSVVLYP